MIGIGDDGAQISHPRACAEDHPDVGKHLVGFRYVAAEDHMDSVVRVQSLLKYWGDHFAGNIFFQ